MGPCPRTPLHETQIRPQTDSHRFEPQCIYTSKSWSKTHKTKELEEIAKVSHGSVLDLIWTDLLTIWKRKEYGLLNCTYYALKCIAGLDRKNKHKQSKHFFDWLRHLKLRKVPVFSQDHLVNITQRRNFSVLFRRPSQTCQIWKKMEKSYEDYSLWKK